MVGRQEGRKEEEKEGEKEGKKEGEEEGRKKNGKIEEKKKERKKAKKDRKREERKIRVEEERQEVGKEGIKKLRLLRDFPLKYLFYFSETSLYNLGELQYLNLEANKLRRK